MRWDTAVSEPALWQRTKAHLSPYGKLVRLENPIDPGTPDVLYCIRRKPAMTPATGLLELKHVPEWPARYGTPLRVAELTKEQVDWHAAWEQAGGSVWTLLQVGRTVLLLSPTTTAQVYERRHTQWSLKHGGATIVSERIFPTVELVKCLSRI